MDHRQGVAGGQEGNSRGMRDRNKRRREHRRGGRARDRTASGIGGTHAGQNSTDTAATGTRQQPHVIGKPIAQGLGGGPVGYKHR